MMKRILVLFIVLFGSQATQAQSADQIIGVWITDNEQAHVEIYKRSGQYFGKIVWVERGLDVNRESVLGTILLSDVTYEKGTWKGTLYVPQKDRNVRCSLELVDEDKLKLTVSRFMSSSSKTWTRL